MSEHEHCGCRHGEEAHAHAAGHACSHGHSGCSHGEEVHFSLPDQSVYLEKIAMFASALRKEGLAIGPEETVDACRVIIMLGMEDKNQLRSSLSAVFAKSREEQITFDRIFNSFFISEEQMRREAREQLQKEKELEQSKQEAVEDLRQQGAPTDLSDEQMETYVTMPEEAREKLRRLVETYSKSIGREPRLYSDFIHSVFARSLMEQQMLMEDAGIGGHAEDPDLGILYRDIAGFKDIEIPKATALIKQISSQLNGELTAKAQHSGHRGKLDFRRTIRQSLETGGNFNRLSYKKKHHKKRRLVMLCDVSGSMMQFSEFALRFIQELHHVTAESSTFLFSEELFHADAFDLANMDHFRSYVRDSGLYGRGTDLGTALEELCQVRPPELTASTTLIILSDAKTIDHHRAVRSLLKAKKMAGQVVWLNPIPEHKWKYLNSTLMFQTVCPMISCSTLQSLAAACRRLTLT